LDSCDYTIEELTIGVETVIVLRTYVFNDNNDQTIERAMATLTPRKQWRQQMGRCLYLSTGEEIMEIYRGIMTAMLAGFLFTGLSACEKEGPAEKAGKAIDDAASNVAKEAGEAKESIEKKMEE